MLLAVLSYEILTERHLQESFDQGCSDDELYPNIWIDDSDLPGFRLVRILAQPFGLAVPNC